MTGGEQIHLPRPLSFATSTTQPLVHLSHTFRRRLSPLIAHSERSCTPPPSLPATPLIHSQLQNSRNTPHLHILKDFRLAPPFFFFAPPHKSRPPSASCPPHPFCPPSSAPLLFPSHPPRRHLSSSSALNYWLGVNGLFWPVSRR